MSTFKEEISKKEVRAKILLEALKAFVRTLATAFAGLMIVCVKYAFS